MTPKLAIYSFPRSGRGFTRKMIFPAGTPDDAMFGGPVYMSHDFDGDDVRDECPNLVLARDPLYCFASWFVMETRNGNLTQSPEALRTVVLEIWAPYWRKFAARHILSGRAPVVWFNWFTQNPFAFADYLEDLADITVENVAVENTSRANYNWSPAFHPGSDLYKEIATALGPEYPAAMNLAGPFA